MTKNGYEERIIAYADIIGWGKASNDISEFNRLQDTVHKIEGYAKRFSEEIKKTLREAPSLSHAQIQQHSSIEFSFFSDNFAISAPVNYGQKLFEILAWASHDLLRERFLVRGGVTIGQIYHHRGIIFGPSLVRAVELEKKEPHYPCILCSEELGQHLEKQTSYMDKVVLKDKYQKLVVNIACGSADAKKDLMTIIERELSMLKKYADKWQYLREMLPKMYGTLISSIIMIAM